MNLNKKIIATFKKTLIFTLILMWAFLPMGDYLFLKIGDWKIALAPKSKIAKAESGSEKRITTQRTAVRTRNTLLIYDTIVP